jgi:pimeloyl-ACP methyl ester carboxylesterase
MNTATASTATNTQAERARPRLGRRILRGIGRGLKWLGIALIVLAVLGVAYQTIATEIDKRTYSPRGQLYTVNGHQMHIVCMGEGSPAVILQAGGGGESLWWYRVQHQLAEHTRVCAYDRPGLGWSEAASSPRDPVTIVGELHTLLEEAGVPAPYVMAGHSYGAILTRVYAWQYPQEVTGLALVDSYTVGLVEQSEIDNTRLLFYVANIPVWAVTHLGLMRFNEANNFEAAGFPLEIVPELAALHSRTQALETDIAEKGVDAYWALTQASFAASDLDDLPMAVLWTSESYAAYDRAAVNEVATFSSNSVTRVIEGANHWSVLGSEQHAQQVSDAILDVIEAAQTGEPLASK